jgi:hypothetical protein
MKANYLEIFNETVQRVFRFRPHCCSGPSKFMIKTYSLDKDCNDAMIVTVFFFFMFIYKRNSRMIIENNRVMKKRLYIQ